jgi:HPt (histidine-containing phosphotransfer) domain-containing protein
MSEELPNRSTKNASEIIDYSVLESFRDFQQPGEPDLVGKLIDLFIADTTKRISVIKRAILDGDAAILKREAHNAKGGAGNIGARRMAACCRELEQAASEPHNATVLISRLEDEFKQVIEALNNVKQPDFGQ